MRAILPMKAMSCSTTTTAARAFSSRISSAMRTVSSSLMPAAGSSSRITLGSRATTMPISTHWRWPWASSPTSLRATARSPSRAFSCSARSRAAREPQALLAASHRFSSTVRPSSTVGTWF